MKPWRHQFGIVFGESSWAKRRKVLERQDYGTIDAMKILILGLVLLLQAKDESTNVWRSLSTYQGANPVDDPALTATQIEAIREALKTDEQIVGCGPEESVASVLRKLRFKRIPLSSKSETALVEAGEGCLRGRQGSNGAMWIVQINRGIATVLASSAEGFEGWIYSIQATTSKGLRDIILGWHVSAREAGLTYFRFDGTRYRGLPLSEVTTVTRPSPRPNKEQYHRLENGVKAIPAFLHAGNTEMMDPPIVKKRARIYLRAESADCRSPI
jgi:hypothetical protein